MYTTWCHQYFLISPAACFIVYCHFTCLWMPYAVSSHSCDIGFPLPWTQMKLQNTTTYAYTCLPLKYCCSLVGADSKLLKNLIMAKKWKNPDLKLKLDYINFSYFKHNVSIKSWSSGEDLKRQINIYCNFIWLEVGATLNYSILTTN
jgi:hypothetical protein